MADEEDFSNLALTDRWVHKNWKVRKEAYESAKTDFNKATGSEPIIRDFVQDPSLWKGAAADANVAAQQEGLAALCAFLDIAGPQGCTRTRSHTIVPIVEKGLTGRPDAKKSALEALMLYVELDKSDPVIEELVPLLSHKQPKIIAATLSALTSLVHAFGCKVIEPKPLLKLLPKVYGHADKNVRAEAQNLTVELYRWLKEAMKPLFWEELKPVQQQDLDKLFEKVKDDPPPKQERLLRSQQAAIADAPDTATSETPHDADDEPQDADIDLEPEHVAVDAFATIPQDLHERVASSKWKDRKDALDELYKAVNVPLLQQGPFDDVIRDCAKSMKDANVAVVTVAANCVEAIAKGLRKSFAKYRSTIFAPMLERFKEKKQSVTDALAAACDALLESTGLTDLLEEIIEFTKHKNPQVKLESAKFLARSLKAIRQAPQLPEVKTMADAATKLLADSQEPTRTAGAEILGVLLKIMGDRNMQAHLEAIDDIKKAKIKEYCDQAQPKAKWKPKAAPAAKPAAPTAQSRPTTTRRPAPGVKRAAPPPRAASPFDENPTSVPPSGPRPLKQPSKIAPRSTATTPAAKKPGLIRPGSLASPRRPGAASDDPVPTSQARGLPAPSRGLAARSLAKPVASNPTPSAETAPAAAVTASYADLAELADLRAETELLRKQNADIRADKVRLQSELHELQHEHATLIDQNAHVGMASKAKDAQLTRSRIELQEADERAQRLNREVDRLTRDFVRLEQSSNTSHTNGDADSSSTRSNSRQESRPLAAARGQGKTLPEIHAANTGKENGYGSESTLKSSAADGVEQSTAAGGSIRRASTLVGSGSSYTGSTSIPRTDSLNKSQTDGVESWKRAAEVTQNLKARIELMKVGRRGRFPVFELC